MSTSPSRYMLFDALPYSLRDILDFILTYPIANITLNNKALHHRGVFHIMRLLYSTSEPDILFSRD